MTVLSMDGFFIGKKYFYKDFPHTVKQQILMILILLFYYSVDAAAAAQEIDYHFQNKFL